MKHNSKRSMPMKQGIAVLLLAVFAISCTKVEQSVLVSNYDELETAISNAQAGDQIIMKNGVWKDIHIRFTGNGTKERPIVIKAETPGKVIITGESDLKFGGNYLTVDGLFFKDGYTPSDAVIQFKIKQDSPANYCRVTHCAIVDYNQLQRDRPDHWVEFWGRHNQLDHCYIAGKSNQGPTVRIKIKGNQSIRNYHQIVYNHFGPRPRKGGPRGETIQVGDSYSSMSPCYLNVAHNLFERCNGEVEIISSKTNFNEFRNNVFYKCEGSLVTRHGNYCTIDGNYFIGDEQSENMGGIRIINTGHWVTNNYFYHLKGKQFRSPLAVMNGIPKSPLNRYNQVTDVVVAHNTWVNCVSPWQFGVGSNISQKDVLPLSEIRSAVPIRTLVANNIIRNETGDKQPIVAHDAIDGIQFESNLFSNQNVHAETPKGLIPAALEMKKIADYIFAPLQGEANETPYAGFEFETITKDLFGNSRAEQNLIGAISRYNSLDPEILSFGKYGATWYDASEKVKEAKTIQASGNDDLARLISNASDGDILFLKPGKYTLKSPLKIDKHITLQSDMAKTKPVISYNGPHASPAFQMHPKGDLTLQNITLTGHKTQYAFACLQENMSSLYNIHVKACDISGFDYVLKAYKESMSDAISFTNCHIHDCENGIELSEETNDKGDYNVEFLSIENCQFSNIQKNVVDYYRGGYDESTIGGNLLVQHSTFSNCGKKEENGILINTRGIVNVTIANNTFKNNPVKLVALLWGAKNNTHSNNEITKSGKLVVEENIKLKILY